MAKGSLLRWIWYRRAGWIALPLLMMAGLAAAAPQGASLINRKLNDRLALGGQVAVMQVSPDGAYIVYLADHTLEGTPELYSVPAAGGNPTRLYSPFDGIYGPPVDFAISADSSRVVYRAEHPGGAYGHKLYSVPIAGGTPQQVSAEPSGLSYNVYDFRISPDSQRVVFRGDLATTDVDELFSAPIDGGAQVKLNGALASGGDVEGDYQISAGGSSVVYRADQQADAVYELYAVSITGGGAVKLNAALVDTGDIWSFAITPDGSRVLYRGDQDTANLNELYSVPIAGGTPVKLSGPLSYIGVFNFVIAPDSSLVVYRADPDASTEYELFSVPVDGGAPVKIAAVPFLRGVEADYQISPDSSTVVYRADLDTRSVVELYSVPVGGGASTRLNNPLTGGHEVLSFRISPGSGHVAYQADDPVSDTFELYGVPIGGGTPVKLNDALVSGGDVQDDYQIGAGCDCVVYRADQNVDETFELFTVPLSGGVVERLNGTLRPESDVLAFANAPGGSHTVYIGGQEDGCKQSLYIVPAGGGTPRRLDDSQAVVGDVAEMIFSPDGQQVVYRADGRQDEVLELFSVPAGGGIPIRLNDTPVAQGDVMGGYQVDPQGNRVVYRADQLTDEIFELFSVPLTGGTPVRLNADLDSTQDVRSFLIGPGGNRVVYEVDSAKEQLFSVPITGGPPVTLTGLLPGVDKVRYQISPDGSTVVFLSGFDQLYSVPIDGGTPVLLHDAASGHIVYPAITPDSSGVVYLDYYYSAPEALYHVPIGGGVPLRLDTPANPNGPDIAYDFQVSDDGSRVVYRGDQDTAGKDELYSVPTLGGVPLKLSGPLQNLGDVTGFQVSADSSTVVYRADQEVDGYHELYRVPLSGGSATKISRPLYVGDNIEPGFILAPDGGHVFYIINQNAATYRDLYLFAASLQTATTYQLGYLYAPNSSSMPIDPQQFKVAADGRYLVYAGVALSGQPVQLFAVPLAGGTPERLNAPLAAGGEVDRFTFQVSPDSQTAIYLADQDTDEVLELYATTRVPAADLQIQKTVTPASSAAPGEVLTYLLTFGNAGDATASGVVISDTIPFELVDLSWDSSGSPVTLSGSVPYRWQVADLAPGAGGVITVTGVIRPEVSTGSVITNSASITSTTVEADDGDNRSQVSTRVTVTKSVYLPLVMR